MLVMENVATTILSQLGGARRLGIMIGAHSFTADKNALIFKFKATNKIRATACKVTLDPSDTYSVKFYRIATRKGITKVETVAEASEVYCDKLKSTVASMTGLFLSM